MYTWRNAQAQHTCSVIVNLIWIVGRAATLKLTDVRHLAVCPIAKPGLAHALQSLALHVQIYIDGKLVLHDLSSSLGAIDSR